MSAFALTTAEQFSPLIGSKDTADRFTRHSPDTGGFAASIALLTGFGNGKLPSLRADEGLKPMAEARQR